MHHQGVEMYKLMILFKSSDDSLQVETDWSTEFVTRAESMPGLRRVSVSRIVGGPGGPADLQLMHELYFDDLQALKQALASPQGQEAGQALISLAGEHVSIYFAQHLEEDRVGASS
jgi:uncharacterized protein (TIGR02118 family)